MGSKTISLKEATYRRLVGVKAEDESFSDVIDRLIQADEQPLAALIGLLEDDQVAALRERSLAFREGVDDRLGAANDE